MLLGAIAGINKDEQTTESYIKPGAATARETNAFADADAAFSGLKDLSQVGPGAQDVTRATNSGRSLADLLQEMFKSGGLPTADDIAQAQQLTTGLFNKRRTSLGQNFADQTTQYNNYAARTGRNPNDPIFAAKMRSGFLKDQNMLDAEEADYGNQLAMSLPGQRLSFAQGAYDVNNGLATQAFKNRAAILSMGSSIGDSERNFRLATGTQYSKGESGGGIKGAITYGVAETGTAAKVAGSFLGGGIGG